MHPPPPLRTPPPSEMEGMWWPLLPPPPPNGFDGLEGRPNGSVEPPKPPTPVGEEPPDGLLPPLLVVELLAGVLSGDMSFEKSIQLLYFPHDSWMPLAESPHDTPRAAMLERSSGNSLSFPDAAISAELSRFLMRLTLSPHFPPRSLS